MAIKLTDKPNTDPASGSYNYGKIRDNDGTNNGTPVNTLVYSDLHLFFEKLMEAGGVTHNGLPDSDDDGYQLYQAFQRAARREMKSLLGILAETFISDPSAPIAVIPPYSLLGITWNSGSTILSAGYIYYNEELLFCGGFTGTISDTAVFTRTGDNILQVTDAVSGSGDFDFADLVFYQQGRIQTVGGSAFGGVTPPAYNATRFAEVGSNLPLRFWKDKHGNVHLEGEVKAVSTNGGLQRIFTLPVGYRPTVPDFIVYVITNNALDVKVLNINNSGEVQIQDIVNTNTYYIGHVIFATT